MSLDETFSFILIPREKKYSHLQVPKRAVLEGTPFADQIDISRCGVQFTYVVVLGSIWIIF
jgi:hypothetical protein